MKTRLLRRFGIACFGMVPGRLVSASGLETDSKPTPKKEFSRAHIDMLLNEPCHVRLVDVCWDKTRFMRADGLDEAHGEEEELG